MAFPLAMLIATSILDPIVGLLHQGEVLLYSVVHNYGWTMILIAAIIKLCFWQLNTMQFKAMLATQALQPRIKELQKRFANDREKLNAETMALYKETGANPLAGCLPLLLQMPILFSVYWSVVNPVYRQAFETQGWLWIGSAFAAATPVVQAAVPIPMNDAHPAFHLLASNLALPDYFLMALYVVSMYFQMRLTTPASDPAMAQQQRIMAFVSPAMVGYFGFKYSWPAALLLYWLSFNIFTMAQQFYLIRKYHVNPAAAATANAVETAPPPKKALSNGAPAAGAPATNGASSNGGGSRAARRRRSSRR